ncbi:MAG: plasmid pRiA4b ORF-3 family protein [Bacteroidales bacterium]|nr:plasmid pRiA4b ORF-3 family protein [Bacteroidales bacterium]
MFYYKFRVYFDEVEDFVRDIEILSNDNFESLHQILYSSIGLEGNELASFSLCDSKWNKQNEITLIDMKDDEVADTPEYDEEDGYTTKTHLPKFIMKDTILNKMISDPHQHILYEYDFLNPKVFYIELMKVAKADDDTSYPRCTHKEQELPKSIKNGHLPDPDELLEDLNNDDLFDDFEDGYNEEDQLDLGSIDEFGSY